MRTIRDGEPRTATLTFTQLLRSAAAAAAAVVLLNVLGFRLTLLGTS